MADFTPITTQEQFDAAIKDRIDRERAKYADYDAIKQKAGEADGLKNDLQTAKAEITKLQNEAKANEGKLADHNKEVGALTERAEKAERSLLRRRIAEEEGIPSSLADRLSGKDEKELREDAKNLAKFVAKGSPAPLFSSEGGNGGAKTVQAAYSTMLNALDKQF